MSNFSLIVISWLATLSLSAALVKPGLVTPVLVTPALVKQNMEEKSSHMSLHEQKQPKKAQIQNKPKAHRTAIDPLLAQACSHIAAIQEIILDYLIDPVDFFVAMTTKTVLKCPQGRYAQKIALNHDGTCLIAGLDNGHVQIWHIPEKKLIQSYQSHKNPLHSARITHDNNYAVTKSDQDGSHVWNVATGKPIIIHKNGYADISHDGTSIITISQDRLALLRYDITGKQLHAIQQNSPIITFLLVHNHAVTKHDNNIIKIWNYITGICYATHTIPMHSDSSAIKLSNDLSKIFIYPPIQSDIEQSTLDIIDLTADKTLKIPVPHAVLHFEHMSNSMRFVPITIPEEGLEIWDTTHGAIYKKLKTNHEHMIMDLAISNNDMYIITISNFGNFRLWNIHTQAHTCIESRNTEATTCAINHDGSMIACSKYNGAIDCYIQNQTIKKLLSTLSLAQFNFVQQICSHKQSMIHTNQKVPAPLDAMQTTLFKSLPEPLQTNLIKNYIVTQITE